MARMTEMDKAIKHFFKNVGVPPKLVYDHARKQISGDAEKLCDIVELEKGTPAANIAVRYIQMLNNETVASLFSINILVLRT